MPNDNKLRFTEGLLITYLSLITYLLTVSKELGFLSFFNIPFNFINLNIFSSAGSFLIIFLALLALYFFYRLIFNHVYNISGFPKRIRNRFLKFLYQYTLRILLPSFIPLCIYFIVCDDLFLFCENATVTLLIFMLLWVLEIQILKNVAQNNRKFTRDVIFNIILLISSFIIFWAAGEDYAKNKKQFLTIDGGKTVVVYFSNDKMFTKPVSAGSLKTNEFSIITLKDSPYTFSTISLSHK